MADSPYNLDPFTTVIDCHWGGGKTNYILVTVLAGSFNAGTTGNPDPPQPPTPVVSFSGAKVLYQNIAVKQGRVKSQTFTTKYFFIWTPAAPFPTTATAGIIVVPDQPGLGFATGYMTQFSQLVDYNFRGAEVVNWLPGTSPELGSYASFGAAATAATVFNNRLLPGSTIQPFLPGGQGAPTAIGAFFAAELDVPQVFPGTASTSITATYLLAMTDTASVTVAVTDGQSAQLTAALYTGQKAKITNPNQLTGGGAAVDQAFGGPFASFTITAAVPKSSPATITVSLGGGGGGGAH